MTTQEATYFILNQLRTIYSEGEALKITDWIMENVTGSAKTERMIYKNEAITEKEELQLQQFAERLMEHEPVQYILNESWFYGLKFYVDKNVLIPRPETEELVDWIIKDCKFPIDQLNILDIGTGSGCIPVSLKRKLRKAELWSCDVSEQALQVAKKNALNLGADINFMTLDFLNKEEREKLPLFDIIVSNPPYIPQKERYQMASNVLEYEPAKALFVPDSGPLIFYKAIADFGKTHLNKDGIIYAEIHENLANEIKELFQSGNYEIEIKKDMQGKDRMMKALII
ncbi:MAG: peptide chain release factor N(5)-glutamine methyltransferase [Chitinophagaceae bacterium]